MIYDIYETSELVDLDNIKSEDLKLMKYCQGLKKEDRLYNLLMEMEPKSWSRAQEIIRKYAQSMAKKADLVESRPKNQGHIMNAMSGGSENPAPRPSSQSPVEKEKNMIPIQEGEKEPRAESPKAVEETAEALATVEPVGTAMRLQTTTTQTLAQSLRKEKMITTNR